MTRNQTRKDDGSTPSRLRVVRIIDRLNIGGPAKHVVWLTAGLNSDEFETTLITGVKPADEGDMTYFAREAGVEPMVIKEMSRELGPRDIIVIGKLLRAFWKLKPDIIHTHKAKAGAAGRIAALLYRWLTPSALLLRPRRCKVAHTFHGHIFHSYYGKAKTRFFVAIERALARLCTDRIVVISEQQRREICERYKVGRPGQFHVIPLGIDFDEMNKNGESLRSELRLTDDKPIIGIVGRLCEVKNHSMFLEAAAQVMRESNGSHNSPHFVIIGDGHLRSALEEQSNELGLSSAVTFTGFREDAPSLYREMDVLALTSLNEGTPLTMIEAMRCARAVAATEVGGVADLMGERRAEREGFTIWDHGVTVASRDTAAMARALSFLIERPELRREMGERGRAFVTKRMSRERLIGDIRQMYCQMAQVSPEMAPTGEPERLAQSN